MVILLNTRGKGSLFVLLGVTIEPVRNLAEDWDELRFLVKLEVLVNVPVDLNLGER